MRRGNPSSPDTSTRTGTRGESGDRSRVAPYLCGTQVCSARREGDVRTLNGSTSDNNYCFHESQNQSRGSLGRPGEPSRTDLHSRVGPGYVPPTAQSLSLNSSGVTAPSFSSDTLASVEVLVSPDPSSKDGTG